MDSDYQLQVFGYCKNTPYISHMEVDLVRPGGFFRGPKVDRKEHVIVPATCKDYQKFIDQEEYSRKRTAELAMAVNQLGLVGRV